MSEEPFEAREKRLREARQTWDSEAAAFDEEPDHGLRHPAVRAAWTGLLESLILSGPKTVLDIGCGTGSLSVVLAGLGHAVTGIDISLAMIALAEAKAAAHGYDIHFQVMDAAFPQFPPGQFDSIVCRHLLWALPQPEQVLQRWATMLKPEGCLVLFEGYWTTKAGLHAEEVVRMLPPAFTQVTHLYLSENPDLWGGKVNDERYAIILRL